VLLPALDQVAQEALGLRDGRPTERDLRVEVTFGREGKSSITWSWDS
jgi:hypothetical protein